MSRAIRSETLERSRHICSLPFGSLQTFFKRDAMSTEKAPERAAAGSNPPLAQLRNGFQQGQIRLSCNQSQHLAGKLFERRSASTARLRCGTLPPSSRSPRNVLPLRVAMPPSLLLQ